MAEAVVIQGGATVKDVPCQPFIQALASHFKEQNILELPEWHDLVRRMNACVYGWMMDVYVCMYVCG